MNEENSGRKCHGWANFETWTVANWLYNVEATYRYWTEQARRWHGREDATARLAEQMRADVEGGSPLDFGSSVYNDLLSTAFAAVDWAEIAGDFLEGVGPAADQEASLGRPRPTPAGLDELDEGEACDLPTSEGTPRLTLEDIERLPREVFEALPEGEKRRYYDHMDRENVPTPAEFYGYEAEREQPGEWPEDDEDWTDGGESCDGRAMPEPTPERQSNNQEQPPEPVRLDAENLFGDVIFAYSREQAIADGVLVDVSETAKEAGFRFPVALTRAVFDKYVAVPDGVVAQDEAGRLWDVLSMCSLAVRRSGGSEVLFSLHVRNDNRRGTPPLVQLKAVCGPDDDASPCITIMMPDED